MGLLSNFGLENRSVDIYWDNQGTIYPAYNYCERMKHVIILTYLPQRKLHPRYFSEWEGCCEKDRYSKEPKR